MNKKLCFLAGIMALLIPVCAVAQEPQKISTKPTVKASQPKEVENKNQVEATRVQNAESGRTIKINEEEKRIKIEEAPASNQEKVDIQNLSAEVNDIKNKLSKLINISGYVNTQFTWEENEASTFKIRRARFDIKGNLSKKAEYRVQFDFANSARLVDAFLKYKFHNAFNIQVGQFKIPFTLENPYAPLKFESIEYSQVITKLSGLSDLSGLGGTGRDLGLAFYGGFFHNDNKNFNYVEYNIGIFNGAKINAADIDTRKDIVGRIDIHPIKPATVSFSYYNGKYDSDLSSTTDKLVDRLRYGAGVKFDDNKYLFRAEYIWGKTANKESMGYYAVAGMKVSKTLSPFIKYDFFQSDITSDNTASTWYVCGLDFWPYSFMRLQVNYTLKSIKTGTGNEYSNMAGAMVSFKF